MCDHALGKDCFQSCYDFHYNFSNKGRVVPKNSHTHPTEGHWKCQGGGGGGMSQRSKIVQEIMNLTGNSQCFA